MHTLSFMAHDDEKADDHSTKGAMIAINQPYPLDRDSYTLVEEIGRGVSSVVHKAICACLSVESSVVAIKVIALQNPKADLEKVLREEAKLAPLPDHPNILRAHCSFTVDDDDEKSLWVVMPFMPGGSLQSIVAWAYPLPEACIAAVLKEILTGMCYLHGHGLPHRDIKASNILIDSDGSVKLADLGISTSVYSSSATGSRPYWMAPEVEVNAFRGDIWSFGITALELARGGPPLSNSHLPPLKSSLIAEVTKIIQSFKDMAGSKSLVMKITKMTECFKHMVGLCLNRDPTKRPTPKILLMHSFFKNCELRVGEDDDNKDRLLILNVLQGVPAVEQRLKEGGEEIDRLERGLEIMKNKRIRGWELNEEGLGLDPVFADDDDVCKEGKGSVLGGKEAEQVMKIMKFLGESSDYQRQTVGKAIESLGGDGGDETSRFEQLMQVIVNLEMEVGNHKTKWYEFDMENQKKSIDLFEMERDESQRISNWAEVDKELKQLQLQLSKEELVG